MPRSNSGISKVAAAVIAVVVIIALIIGVYYATLPPGPTPTPATPTPTPKTPTPTTPTPATSTPTPATPTPATPTPTPATPTPTPATPTPTPATPTPATPTLTPTPTTPTPATPTPGPEKIKVGMIASLTGALATVGRVQRIIAEEAVKTINSEDGINVKQYGRKIPIEVVLVDDESNPGRATELAVKLATEGGVVIVVCQSYAFISTPVAKVTERYGIPLLNTSPVEFFAAAGPWNYSWCYATSYLRHVEGFVAFLNNYRGQTNNKVGVVLSDDIIGRTQNQMLTSMLEQAGYTVFNPGLYPPDTT
ncbi:MAG: ABC transporter substrate-binding protein, partial [Candidatus Bathyarchaeia archaeon]